ncbi:Hypothetical protein NTJ_16294 [Nesidiocoris tenuis]|nr:Hypothetical protein NTJ_16294 [Nesidiocoris tenuis]
MQIVSQESVKSNCCCYSARSLSSQGEGDGKLSDDRGVHLGTLFTKPETKPCMGWEIPWICRGMQSELEG